MRSKTPKKAPTSDKRKSSLLGWSTCHRHLHLERVIFYQSRDNGASGRGRVPRGRGQMGAEGAAVRRGRKKACAPPPTRQGSVGGCSDPYDRCSPSRRRCAAAEWRSELRLLLRATRGSMALGLARKPQTPSALPSQGNRLGRECLNSTSSRRARGEPTGASRSWSCPRSPSGSAVSIQAPPRTLV